MEEKTTKSKAETLSLPLLITRGLVVFPNMTESIEAGRLYSLAAVDQARKVTNSLLFVTSQKDPKVDDISEKDVYEYGTLCRIVNFVAQDKIYRLRVIGSKRVRFSNVRMEGGTFLADGVIIDDVLGDKNEETALVRKVVSSLEASPSIGRDIPKSALGSLSKGVSATELTDTLAAYLPLGLEEKQKLIAEPNVNARLNVLIGVIGEQQEIAEIDEKLNDTVRERAEKQQKEYFLREKMKAIKDELGEGGDEAESEDSIKEKLEKNPYPDNVKSKVKSELHRFEMMPEASLEASLIMAAFPDLVACLSKPLTFEGRTCNFFVKEGSEETFKTLFEEHFGDNFVLLSRQDVLSKGYFGEGEAPKFALSFLGDFIAVATGKDLLVNSADKPITFVHKGHHAGATKEERDVMVGGEGLKKAKAGDIVKELAKHLGGGGGGKPEMASGQLVAKEGLEAAIASLKETLK